MKHVLKHVVFAFIVMALLSGCGKEPTQEIKEKVKADSEALKAAALPQEKGHVKEDAAAKAMESAKVKPKKSIKKEIKEMAVKETMAVIETKFGNIELKFFPEIAPNHVDSFIGLAKKGFYDGTTFHRVIPGFMIQGGDPNSKSPDRTIHGTGGPGYTVKAEFTDKKHHQRGILSMARAQHPDSAGAQFFICVSDSLFLDGKYTIFGEVVSGMGAVDKIVNEPKDERDNPLDRIDMKIKIIEK